MYVHVSSVVKITSKAQAFPAFSWDAPSMQLQSIQQAKEQQTLLITNDSTLQEVDTNGNVGCTIQNMYTQFFAVFE
jgi:hypothetical protein